VEERARNEQVKKFQGNINPFVDDYRLADKIGADALRASGAASARLARATPRTAWSPDTGDDRRSDKRRDGGRRRSRRYRGRDSRDRDYAPR
jgi:hypothetical protein